MRLISACICLFVFLVVGVSRAEAERRVALVIGNSSYAHTTVLDNPKNDATAIAAALKRLNFEVVLALDVAQAQTARPISEFVSLLEGADVGLLFYAGHGLVYDERNYLVPIDASIENHISVKFQMTPIDQIVDEMARSVRLSIIILDACRDNPFVEQLARSAGSSRSTSVGRGLARMESVGTESFIFFATGPKKVAADGAGRHSPFTAALLNHIEKENVTIEDVLRDVRRDVREATRGDQLPEGWLRLERRFQFKPSGKPEQVEPSLNKRDDSNEVERSLDERIYWESVRDLGDPDLLKNYLKEYPKGKYADIARRMIAKLTAAVPPSKPQEKKAEKEKADSADSEYDAAVGAGTVAALAAFVGKHPDDPRAGELKRALAERNAWQAAQRSDTQDYFERYLLAYPNGTYASAARERLAALARQETASRNRNLEPPPAPVTTPAPETYSPGQIVLPSFNCQENTKPAEQTICSQARLAQLDLELVRMYTLVFGRLGLADGKILRDSQRAFLKGRDSCQWDGQCIEQRYLGRIQELRSTWGG